MNRTFQGNVLLLAALGMLLSSLGPELQKLASASDLLSMAFIGTVFTHLGSVITAYFAGQVKETGENTMKVVDAITEKTGS